MDRQQTYALELLKRRLLELEQAHEVETKMLKDFVELRYDSQGYREFQGYASKPPCRAKPQCLRQNVLSQNSYGDLPPFPGHKKMGKRTYLHV